MKKIITIVAALALMAGALTGCGTANDSSSAGKSTENEKTERPQADAISGWQAVT